MAYEIYKVIKSKEDYFNTWTSQNYRDLSVELQNEIYNKYVVKCTVFQRDMFVCQNSKCTTKESPLTLHHFKFKKNGGNDTVRNGVVLCRACHMGYHKAKKVIVYNDSETLPPHMRGATQQLHKDDRINWKQIKADMKVLRQDIKFKLDESIKKVPIGQRVWYKLTWEQIYILLRFLENPIEKWDD